MDAFHHKNQNRVLRLLGGFLILIGLIALGTAVFFEVETPFSRFLMASTVPLLFGLFLISTYSGTLINFGSNRSRAYQSILWMKFGPWEDLPKIIHTELIHHSYFGRNRPNGISPTIGGEITVYKCVLVAEGRKFMVFDYWKESEAIDAMEKLRIGLAIS